MKSSKGFGGSNYYNSNQGELVVLNEANEPEEEEDTYDDSVRLRQQRLYYQKLSSVQELEKEENEALEMSNKDRHNF